MKYDLKKLTEGLNGLTKDIVEACEWCNDGEHRSIIAHAYAEVLETIIDLSKE